MPDFDYDSILNKAVMVLPIIVLPFIIAMHELLQENYIKTSETNYFVSNTIVIILLLLSAFEADEFSRLENAASFL